MFNHTTTARIVNFICVVVASARSIPGSFSSPISAQSHDTTTCVLLFLVRRELALGVALVTYLEQVSGALSVF